MTRRVNIGAVKGETPKKGVFFYRDDIPSNIEIATPERDGVFPQKGALRAVSKFVDSAVTAEEAVFSSPEKLVTRSTSAARPTTSRGKARPSPEEMFNYVVSSPDRRNRGQLDDVASTLVFEDASQARPAPAVQRGDLRQHRSVAAPAARLADEYDDSDSTDSGSQMGASEASQLERSERLVALGCWLFGSAISV